MNYSKYISKKAIAMRVIFLLICVSIVSLITGICLGYALRTHITAKSRQKIEDKTNEQYISDFALYGAYDDKCFTEEPPLEWKAESIDFVTVDCKMPEKHQEFLYYLCTEYNIDFTFVMALIQCESSFNPDLISSTNDYGYMQINKINQEQLTEILGVTDYLDPYQNIRAGMFVLRKLFERYQDSNMVLMAYNMGENAANSLWEKGVFKTEYTNEVMRIQRSLLKGE